MQSERRDFKTRKYARNDGNYSSRLHNAPYLYMIGAFKDFFSKDLDQKRIVTAFFSFHKASLMLSCLVIA